MTPAISIDRYRHRYSLLADLAVWLRDGRAGQYEAMIAKGQISEADAFRDQTARAAIAADYIAIADHTPREDEPYCRATWSIWALEEALAIQQRRLDRLAVSDPSREDHVDLRDAIAALLHHYRGGFVLELLAFNAVRQQIAARQEQPA